jgi:hypothetical protein
MQSTFLHALAHSATVWSPGMKCSRRSLHHLVLARGYAVHGMSLSRDPATPILFLIEELANFFGQGVEAEGFLQKRHFGIQNTVANHNIVGVATLK